MTTHPMDVRSPCARYQDALLDFVDRGEAGSGVASALAHLERCQVCERDLAATALVLTALRRLFDEARAAESPLDAWPRLRARVSQRPPKRRPMGAWSPGTITGLVTGAALVTALLLPNAAHLANREYAVPAAEQTASDALRMLAPGSGRGDPDGPNGLSVHLERGNVDPRRPGISLPTPYPDNIHPAPVTTAVVISRDPSRVLHPA